MDVTVEFAGDDTEGEMASGNFFDTRCGKLLYKTWPYCGGMIPVVGMVITTLLIVYLT